MNILSIKHINKQLGLRSILFIIAKCDGASYGVNAQGERMSVQNAINQANKVDFSYTKRRKIIPDGLTAASLRQIFV